MRIFVPALCLLHLSCSYVFASEQKVERTISVVNADETKFTKDEIQCSGNVMVVYFDNVISASKLTYSKSEKSISAEGNVILKDKRGNTYFCDSAKLTQNFESGEMKNLKIILSDQSRLASDSCKIRNQKLELENVIYSPCYECNQSGELTWQLKATSVIFDPNDDIVYRDVRLEAFGVPVIYTPYLSQTSITVKRKSGFLPPKFSSSSTSGFSLHPKYVFCLSPSQEFILKPIITSKIGSVFWGSYKQRLQNGEFSIDASITGTKSVKKYSTKDEKEKKVIEKIKHSGYRGHIFSKLTYDINEIWRLKSDINLASDMYYLKRFPFFKSIHDKFDKTLESNVKLEGFDGRNYTSIKSAMFQSEYTDYIPKILPVIERNYSRRFLDGTLNVNSIVMNVIFHHQKRTIDPDEKTSRLAQKFLSNISWERRLMLAHGNIIDINGLLSFKGQGKFRAKDENFSSHIKISPQINVNWKWPLLTFYESLRVIITPMVGFILSDRKKYADPLDDPFREVNDINLFEGSRSVSSYNIDVGSRMCYGFKIAAYKKDGKDFGRFTIGRSREFTSPSKEHSEVSGLKYKNSDIISAGELFLTDELKLSASGSYCTKKGRWTRFMSGLKFTKDKYSLEGMVFNGKQSSFDPFGIDDGLVAPSTEVQKYKGIMIDAGYQMNKKIKFDGGIILGDKNCRTIKHHIGFSYTNECTTLKASLERTSYRGGDLKPETSFKILVHLKNIGG